MYPTTLLLSCLAVVFGIVYALPAELELAEMFERSIGSACTTPDGSGTCQQTTSCTSNGFNLAGYCPNDPSGVQCCVKKTCSTSTGSGVCINTNDPCSGHFVAGACPGPTSVQCCAVSKCSTSSGAGTCQDTASSCSGSYIAGACPGPSSIQCCVPKVTCSTSSGSGVCQNTATACSGGHYVTGACPGATNIQCCVSGTTPSPSTSPSPSSTPSPTGELMACDISSAKASTFYSCAKRQGIQKVIARGYSQACSSGGAVDTNMVAAYKAAKAAGITSFDAYMYPCTGSQPTGVACKPIQTQINEFLAAIDQNGIVVNYLWFDIEPTSTAAGNPCNSWQLGASGNEALAKQWTAALRATGRKWGIYANAGQWTSMFASISTDVGSDLPLWAVQADSKPGVSTTTRFMGGWTKAYAKQYRLSATLCSGSVDLDSFTA